MKLCKNISLVVFVLVISTLAVFTANAQQSYQPEVTGNYISFDFNQITGGMVNLVPNATVNKNVTIGGVNAVEFVPTPKAEGAKGFFTLECYKLASYAAKVTVPDYKYVGVTYYYAPKTTPTYTGNLKMIILPGFAKAIKESISAESHEPLVAGKWTETYFDFSSITLNPDHVQDKDYLTQCHLLPFGDTPATSLSEGDVLYVAKYTFYKKVPTVNISYNKAVSEAVGDEYIDVVTYGEPYKLPQCKFVYDGFIFKGWLSSVDNKVYAPGTGMTSKINTTYTASWENVNSYDVNNDGVFNYKDIRIILEEIAGIDCSKYNINKADLDSDGRVTLMDLSRFMSYIKDQIKE